MSLLCVNVKRALLVGPDAQFETYVTLKLQNVKSTTIAVKGSEPNWEQDFLFETSRMDTGLIIELWNKGLLWDKLMGCHWLPLMDIHFGGEGAEGRWISLDAELVIDSGEIISGSRTPTGHKLYIEAHFEPPYEHTIDDVKQFNRKVTEFTCYSDQVAYANVNETGKKHPFYYYSGVSEDSDYTSDVNCPIDVQHSNVTSHHENSPAFQFGGPSKINTASMNEFTLANAAVVGGGSNQFLGPNRKLPNPTAPSHFNIVSGNEDRIIQRPTRISPRKLPKLHPNNLPRSPGHTSTVHYTSDAFEQSLVNKGTMDTLDLNHMLTSSSPYALTPVKSPIEPFGQREKHHLLNQQQQHQQPSTATSHLKSQPLKLQQQKVPTATISNKSSHSGHDRGSGGLSELSMKEQLTMEDNIQNEFDDYYPEISGRDETSESKWIFDPDKGWVPNPNVSPVPCINHHTLYSSSTMTTMTTSSNVTASGHKKKKYEQSGTRGSTSLRDGDEFSLLADAPGKGLGAKITAVLGGDVVTVIGSQTGNEPVDTNKEVPPPPAPDFPDVKRPASGLKRSSPVSPTKKPVIKERKSNNEQSDHRSSGPSKKDLWKNSTKTESMIWSTVDEELVDANNQFNSINCIDDPSHSNNFYAHNLSENNFHLSLKHQQPSTSSSSSHSKVHPSPSSTITATATGKHIHHKLPQVPLGGPKPKRNSLERQNEISLDDRTVRPLMMDSNIGHGTTSEMSSIASFTSQIQSSQSSAIYTGHHHQQQQHHHQQQATAFDKQSFNQFSSSDALGRSNHSIITSSSTGLPIVTSSTNEQQFSHLQDSRLDQSGKLFTGDHLTQPYNLQSQLQQQQQQPFAPSSNLLPSSTYSPSVPFVTSSIATTATSTLPATSQFQQQLTTTQQQLTQQQQQHPSQQQPPSALRHESKAPGESQKTVTFSEQLHQEVTFNPSNASSPFPINESIHSSFDTLSSSGLSIKDTSGQVDKSSSLVQGSYYTSSVPGDISLATSITSESIIPPSTMMTTSASQQLLHQQQQSSSLLLEPPSGALRRSSITSITGQQQQQQQSQQQQSTLGQQGQGQLPSVGQLSQQGQLLDTTIQSVTSSDIKVGDESIISTGGLREYEPDNVDGLSKARIRWLAAFNKVVAQMNEVSVCPSLSPQLC